jgi:adenine phosphoribosyltransferase
MHSELRKHLIDQFRWVDPDPTSTHLVSDMSGWWRDPRVLTGLGPALADAFRDRRPTVVVSPEVTGMMLGPLVAVALGVGFVPAYKGGGREIAEPTSWAWTGPDHREQRLALGIRDRHVRPGDRVLVVDDWITTGAQIRAVYELVTGRGAEPVGSSVVVSDCPPELLAELRIHALLDVGELGP